MRSRAEEGGGGRDARPGLFVGTEGNVGDVGRSVGTEGKESSCSFNSSIEGNACANSDSVRVGCKPCLDDDEAEDAGVKKSNVRGDRGSSGEEPVEEEGDGGPSDDVDTNACGEERVEGGNVGDATLCDGWAGGEARLEKVEGGGLGDKGGGRDTARGEVGGALGETLKSREKRFGTPTERPASCRERIRSAMDPPGLRLGPSVESTPPLASPISLVLVISAKVGT